MEKILGIFCSDTKDFCEKTDCFHECGSGVPISSFYINDNTVPFFTKEDNSNGQPKHAPLKIKDSSNRLFAEIQQNKNKCFYCDFDFKDAKKRTQHATKEHIVPVSRGGNGQKINLLRVCGECNSIRGRKVFSNLLDEALNHKTNILPERVIQVMDYVNKMGNLLYSPSFLAEHGIVKENYSLKQKINSALRKQSLKENNADVRKISK